MKVDWKLSDFNEKGHLRTPVPLLLTLAFLSRDLLLLLVGGISEFKGGGTSSTLGVVGLPPVWMLPTNLPAVLFLVLTAYRDRLGEQAWWRRSMGWLVPSLVTLTVIQAAVAATTWHAAFAHLKPLPLLELAGLAACLVYLVRGRKLRYFIRECSVGTGSSGGEQHPPRA